MDNINELKNQSNSQVITDINLIIKKMIAIAESMRCDAEKLSTDENKRNY
jgi:hypothetical protein